jgi:hypothetical protein
LCRNGRPNWFAVRWLNAAMRAENESPLPPTAVNISIAVICRTCNPPLHSSLLQGAPLAGIVAVLRTLPQQPRQAHASHKVSLRHHRAVVTPPLHWLAAITTALVRHLPDPLISQHHAANYGPRTNCFTQRHLRCVVRADFSFPSQSVTVIWGTWQTCTTEMLPCARSIITKADHGSFGSLDMVWAVAAALHSACMQLDWRNLRCWQIGFPFLVAVELHVSP